jgi:uncharacterized C2H2 Zn-finger protein
MVEHECERCGVLFKMKKHLVQHLNKRVTCISINSERSRIEILDELNKKEGVECEECKRVYKNEESLRKHSCKAELGIEKEVTMKQEAVTIVNNNDCSIINNNGNSTTTQNTNSYNTVNIKLNCIKTPRAEAIQYLFEREDSMELFINCAKSIKGIKKYIDAKYYDKEHPENMMIKKGETSDIMYLHEAKWKKYDILKGADILLLSTGIDIEYYMSMLFETDEEKYGIVKSRLQKMNSVILDYLGVNYPDSIDEISEEEEKTKQLVKCESGYYLKDVKEIEREEKYEQSKVYSVKIVGM